jgi:RNase P subunit RPR2
MSKCSDFYFKENINDYIFWHCSKCGIENKIHITAVEVNLQCDLCHWVDMYTLRISVHIDETNR